MHWRNTAKGDLHRLKHRRHSTDGLLGSRGSLNESIMSLNHDVTANNILHATQEGDVEQLKCEKQLLKGKIN